MAWKKTKKNLNRDLLKNSEKLIDQEISPEVWLDNFVDILTNYTEESVLEGKILAGGKRILTDEDEKLIIERVGVQSDYLGDFFEAISEDGDYFNKETGEYNNSKILWRTSLYTNTVRSAGNYSWLIYIEDDEIYWELTGFEHCSDCPWLSATSPIPKELLYTVPGAGDTECLMNCTCYLRTKNGRTSLKF